MMKAFIGLLLVPFAIGLTSRPDEPIILPTLNNTNPVGVKNIAMIDENRRDPFTNNTQFRELMVSLYYPVDGAPSQPLVDQQANHYSGKADTVNPYMPPATAANFDALLAEFGVAKGTFSRLFTRCQANAPIPKDLSSYPLVMFSPGAAASRFIYTTIAQEIACKGYIVACLDHSYDALVVEFPDGRLIHGIETDSRDIVELMVQVRAQDVSFVLDELVSSSLLSFYNINVNDTVAFGHSLGGATTAEVMLHDTRIKGGVNLDGKLFGSMEKPDTTLSKPFIQFGRARNGTNEDQDREWKRLSGWKLELQLEEAAHTTFSDFPLLAEAIGLRKRLGRKGDELLGKVDGLRVLEIMVAYVTAFADYVLTGKKSSLLSDDGGGRFPEVKVLRRG